MRKKHRWTGLRREAQVPCQLVYTVRHSLSCKRPPFELRSLHYLLSTLRQRSSPPSSLTSTISHRVSRLQTSTVADCHHGSASQQLGQLAPHHRLRLRFQPLLSDFRSFLICHSCRVDSRVDSRRSHRPHPCRACCHEFAPIQPSANLRLGTSRRRFSPDARLWVS